MSDDTGELRVNETKRPGKLRLIATLLATITIVLVPILISRTMLYDENGISKNALISQIVLPGVWSAFLLLTIILIVRARLVGDLDFVWYRWMRSEVILAILLITIITIVYPFLGVLLCKLGLPFSYDLKFRADQQGLAFFVGMTIFTAIIGPILEEIFWRGYVQRVLERIFGGAVAWFVQAIPFAIYHFMPLGRFLQVFLFGLTMGVWRWRRRTLLPIILTHIAINSLLCAIRWPGLLDCTKIKIETNYVAEFIEFTKPSNYDPNNDARDDYAKAGRLISRFPKVLQETRRCYPTGWSYEELGQAEAYIKSNKNALDLIEKGAIKPYYWVEYKVQNERMPLLPKDINKVRDYVSALCMRAMLRTAKGQYGEGFDDLETCYKLSRHLEANKEMICRLAGYGARGAVFQTTRMVLAHEKIDSPLLGDIQRRFEEFVEDDVVGFDFTAEKFLAKDYIQCIFTDDGHGNGHVARCMLTNYVFSDRKINSMIGWLTFDTKSNIKRWRKLKRRKTIAQVDQYYDFCEKICSWEPWQYRNTSALRMSLETLQIRNPLIKALSPRIELLVNMAGKARIDRDATIVILAILRYKEDTKQLPDTLSDLISAGYLKVVPSDPFQSGLITYRQMDNDFLLYSFGADFDDDRGTPSKWGEGKEGGDQVFWPVQIAKDYSEPLIESK